MELLQQGANHQNLPVAAVAPIRQNCAVMSEAESQFSFPCAASSARRCVKHQVAMIGFARSQAAAVAALFLALAPAPAAPHLVAIGDSLTTNARFLRLQVAVRPVQ
jgi:hypothetical protein